MAHNKNPVKGNHLYAGYQVLIPDPSGNSLIHRVTRVGWISKSLVLINGDGNRYPIDPAVTTSPASQLVNVSPSATSFQAGGFLPTAP